jgi:single-strand DNA-binding protein
MTNTVLLVGNLGADPELRSANSGTDIASFSLGTSRPKRDSEGKTYKDASGFTAKDTEWHRVTCFNGLGRIIAQHATKGMLVSVRGRLHYTRWTRSSPRTSSSLAGPGNRAPAACPAAAESRRRRALLNPSICPGGRRRRDSSRQSLGRRRCSAAAVWSGRRGCGGWGLVS